MSSILTIPTNYEDDNMYNDDGYNLIQAQKEFEEWLKWYEKEDYKFCHTD